MADGKDVLHVFVAFCAVFVRLCGSVALAVEVVRQDGANVVPISYYNLKGERFDYPQSGMNIIRYSNGQTKKVLITE